MDDSTVIASISRKGHIMYHVDAGVMDEDIEMEIDTGDANHTKYKFRFVNGQVVIKKLSWAKGSEQLIKQISSGADNILIIQ